ncbi:hypothetical protein G3M58_36880 [Streptomyces sp. SID7499]|uniref:Uncharacterized protein n=1 Tax=Streptomyces sp. SID7499 TaxID=2706086 RepID=A0A6G3X2K2_9ACTN|nr:hypothetical protein [Streptomyces sp. SID7499]
MTDLPYTDEGLRAEAARQHRTLTEDPDFVGVGEQMVDEAIAPDCVQMWGDLPEDDYDTAQRKIHDLINGAADVSEWAVNLGADGLQPSNEHAITIDGNGAPIARIHFAFEPDMPDEMRNALVEGLGGAIADAL